MPTQIRPGYLVLNPARFGVRRVLVEANPDAKGKVYYQMAVKGKTYRYVGVVGRNIAFNLDDAKKLYDAAIATKINGLTMYIERLMQKEMEVVDCTE